MVLITEHILRFKWMNIPAVSSGSRLGVKTSTFGRKTWSLFWTIDLTFLILAQDGALLQLYHIVQLPRPKPNIQGSLRGGCTTWSPPHTHTCQGRGKRGLTFYFLLFCLCSAVEGILSSENVYKACCLQQWVVKWFVNLCKPCSTEGALH